MLLVQKVLHLNSDKFFHAVLLYCVRNDEQSHAMCLAELDFKCVALALGQKTCASGVKWVWKLIVLYAMVLSSAFKVCVEGINFQATAENGKVRDGASKEGEERKEKNRTETQKRSIG